MGDCPPILSALTRCQRIDANSSFRPAGAPVALMLAGVEESAEELYEDAPCGYMSSLMDGTIVPSIKEDM